MDGDPKHNINCTRVSLAEEAWATESKDSVSSPRSWEPRWTRSPALGAEGPSTALATVLLLGYTSSNQKTSTEFSTEKKTYKLK